MCVCVCVLSHVCLFAAPWAIGHQAPLSTGFPRQEYWSGLPFHTPEDLLNSGIEPTSLMSPALAGRFFTTSATCEAYINIYVYIFTYTNMYLYIYIYIHTHTCILSNTFSQTSLRYINSLFLPFKYVYFAWYFLALVCWLELPILWWKAVVRVDILVIFSHLRTFSSLLLFSC